MGKHVKINDSRRWRLIAPAAAVVALAGVLGAPAAYAHDGDDGGGDNGGGGDSSDGGGWSDDRGGHDDRGDGDNGDSGWSRDDDRGGDQAETPAPAAAPEPAAPEAAAPEPAAPEPVAVEPAPEAVAPEVVAPAPAPVVPVEIVTVAQSRAHEIVSAVPLLDASAAGTQDPGVPAAVGTGVALAALAGFAGLLVSGRTRPRG